MGEEGGWMEGGGRMGEGRRMEEGGRKGKESLHLHHHHSPFYLHHHALPLPSTTTTVSPFPLPPPRPPSPTNTTILLKNRGVYDFSVNSWYFDSKITNWPINQLRGGFGKMLLFFFQNSIADTLLKTKSFYEVSRTFQLVFRPQKSLIDQLIN